MTLKTGRVGLNLTAADNRLHPRSLVEHLS